MDVVLAVLPFADIDRPAIGVSLLKAEVAAAGFSCAVEYLNFDLAEAIGHRVYTDISESIPSESLVGEWFFADVVFPDQLPHEQEYVNRILSRHAAGPLIAEIQAARGHRHDFVNTATRALQALEPKVVGFTTTFHQTCCCLAVANRLKRGPNPPTIIFGGANCEADMGLQLLRSFPWIDYVCTREGDRAFPAFVTGLLRGGTFAVPGILKQGEATALTTPDLVTNLDELPIPDYADYMARLGRSDERQSIRPEMLFESSRGCWWGAKHHCTFCGLNGETMHFRSKSPERVFAELSYLRHTWGISKIDCVDNILDMRYIDTLFPHLASAGLDLEMFYEVKANLRFDQVAALHAGGVRTIQPGIESFSNAVLRLMRKGCTGVQNIQLLRWCEEAGIAVAWNILGGFPGEPPEEYARMAELLPLLAHLPPPSSCAPIRLDRFSPLFTQRDEIALRRVRPTPAYYYVYPLGGRDLSRLAYFFEFEYPDGRSPQDYIAPVKREVEQWLLTRSGDADKRPRLDATIGDDGDVEITDTRPCAVRPQHRLTGVAAEVYLACDSGRSIGSLVTQLGGGASESPVADVLAGLRSDRLMVEMEGRHLALAVLRNRPALRANEERHVDIRVPQTAPAEQLLRAV